MVVVLFTLGVFATAPAVQVETRGYEGPEAAVGSLTNRPAAPPDIDLDAVLLDAAAARERQDWSAVRVLLSPLLVDDIRARFTADERRAVLRLLAGAALLDSSLPAEVRRETATRHLEGLLEGDPRWVPEVGVDAPELAALYDEIHPRWLQRRAEQCEQRLALCHAASPASGPTTPAVGGSKAPRAEVVSHRSRAIALLPFGIGHFYSGHTKIGAAFLVAEVATALTGLGLLAYREHQCWHDGPNLVCVAEDLEGVVHRRQAEQAMGIATLSLLAVDVVVAQILFPTEDAARRTDRHRRRRARVSAGTPTARPIRGGAAIGWDLRF